MLYGGNRNKCSYGIKCYRENLQHILDYSHDEINRDRFNKIIKFYKTPNYDIRKEMYKDDSIYKFKNGYHFGMILWVLENKNKFNIDEKNIIRKFFTLLEEDAKVDPILDTRDRNEEITFKNKVMTAQKLWETKLCNTILLFSL